MEILNTLKNIDNKTAVYINPNETEYWNFQSACRTKFNIIQSIAGLATLYGSPPKKYGCGIDDYTANYIEDTSAVFLNDERICINARKININKIIKLSNFSDEELKINFLSCE